jgi:tetratricopeptide (TPR) repeat protein
MIKEKTMPKGKKKNTKPSKKPSSSSSSEAQVQTTVVSEGQAQGINHTPAETTASSSSSISSINTPSATKFTSIIDELHSILPTLKNLMDQYEIVTGPKGSSFSIHLKKPKKEKPEGKAHAYNSPPYQVEAEDTTDKGLSTVFLEAVMRNDVEKVIEIYTKLIGLHPKVFELYVMRGATMSKLCDKSNGYANSDQIIADFNTAIKLNPDFAPTYFCLGKMYSVLGLYGKACDNFDEVVKMRHKCGEADYEMGLLHQKMKMLPEIAESYFAAAREKGLDIEAYKKDFEGFWNVTTQASAIVGQNLGASQPQATSTTSSQSSSSEEQQKAAAENSAGLPTSSVITDKFASFQTQINSIWLTLTTQMPVSVMPIMKRMLLPHKKALELREISETQELEELYRSLNLRIAADKGTFVTYYMRGITGLALCYLFGPCKNSSQLTIDPELVIKDLNKAKELNSDFGPTYCSLAEIHLMLGNFKAADDNLYHFLRFEGMYDWGEPAYLKALYYGLQWLDKDAQMLLGWAKEHGMDTSRYEQDLAEFRKIAVQNSPEEIREALSQSKMPIVPGMPDLEDDDGIPTASSSTISSSSMSTQMASFEKEEELPTPPESGDEAMPKKEPSFTIITPLGSMAFDSEREALDIWNATVAALKSEQHSKEHVARLKASLQSSSASSNTTKDYDTEQDEDYSDLPALESPVAISSNTTSSSSSLGGQAQEEPVITLAASEKPARENRPTPPTTPRNGDIPELILPEPAFDTERLIQTGQNLSNIPGISFATSAMVTSSSSSSLEVQREVDDQTNMKKDEAETIDNLEKDIQAEDEHEATSSSSSSVDVDPALLEEIADKLKENNLLREVTAQENNSVTLVLAEPDTHQSESEEVEQSEREADPELEEETALPITTEPLDVDGEKEQDMAGSDIESVEAEETTPPSSPTQVSGRQPDGSPKPEDLTPLNLPPLSAGVLPGSPVDTLANSSLSSGAPSSTQPQVSDSTSVATTVVNKQVKDKSICEKLSCSFL